ncbi:uncharacterized protein EDB93DRAFT_1101827 [Suillus bovinus]|uniref:uncharacterized protein n=1 Tax=Suillus bovinus TaxID=48563 RepID=UPI001B8800B3|nr:uncharacterized protein EDB93DRAFT_1101827 [Suillus bovinus]KAG2155255.1 hypothetical protein EDB93DRAFT_1101827 [Suillus bovinus]
MASWIDIFSFLTITTLFLGTILIIILVVKSLSAAAQQTKQSLQDRGISISDKGVSIKTSKRFDRENYVDATQRGIIKVLDASNFSPNSMDNSEHHLKSKSTSNLLQADDSDTALSTKIFGMRRTTSRATLLIRDDSGAPDALMSRTNNRCNTGSYYPLSMDMHKSRNLSLFSPRVLFDHLGFTQTQTLSQPYEKVM